MTIPVVSVVMSVFNGEHFLQEAIESILRQSFRDFEFIIINDGSTDESGSILDYYRRCDPRLRVYHQENKGLIESLNRGCGLANGKYIARMDADDIAMDDRLMCQVDRMEKHRDLGLLGGAVEWIDTTGKSLGIHRHPCESRIIKTALADGSPFAHPTVLIRREVFLSVGGYRPVVVDAEDYDLWLRIADRFDLANLQAVVLKYRIHPGQVSERKCEQQALSSLAARAAALSRINGGPDPLDSVAEITPEALERLGISQAAQRNALARHWLTRIRNMYEIGELSATRSALENIRSDYFKYAESWVINDFRLLEARVLWDQRRFAKSVSRVARALISRPAILGRPAKRLLERVRGAWRARQEIYQCESIF
jgi:glycosyltransferase involved in cell wall biosynthesis